MSNIWRDYVKYIFVCIIIIILFFNVFELKDLLMLFALQGHRTNQQQTHKTSLKRSESEHADKYGTKSTQFCVELQSVHTE